MERQARRAITTLFMLCIISFFCPARCVAQSSESELVNIAVTVPLTGDFASYGDSIRKGVELARDDLSRQGFKSKVIFEDACLPGPAVAAIQRLTTVNRIHALAANFCVIAVPPMAPVIERNKILTFHTASVSDSILDAGQYIFGTNIKVREEAAKLAEYAVHGLHAKTASILFLATDFGEDYNKHFALRFEELGGKIVSSDRSAIGVNDFKAELTKIRAKNPDVLFAAHLGLTLGVLLKQKREVGLKSKILSVYEAEDPSVLNIAKEGAEGVQFFVPEPIIETEAVKAFRRNFKARYSEDARILASNAYDGTILAVKSLAECHLDADCARDRVRQIKNYDGVSGQFSFDEDGGVQRGLVLKTVKDGQFVNVH